MPTYKAIAIGFCGAALREVGQVFTIDNKLSTGGKHDWVVEVKSGKELEHKEPQAQKGKASDKLDADVI